MAELPAGRGRGAREPRRGQEGPGACRRPGSRLPSLHRHLPRALHLLGPGLHKDPAGNTHSLQEGVGEDQVRQKGVFCLPAGI